MVALSEYGCSTAVFATVPPDCAVSRGNLFNLNQSSSWHDIGTYEINQNGVGLEANLGYTQRAQFGLEHLAIGLTGPSLDNQTIAGIATPEPFYLYVTLSLIDWDFFLIWKCSQRNIWSQQPTSELQHIRQLLVAFVSHNTERDEYNPELELELHSRCSIS